MNKQLFRDTCPKRSYNGNELSDYRQYKTFLATDFHGRCGYTDCSHFWFGGRINFQIDHFLPKSKYPELTTSYSNLVYTCSYVNRAKSDDDGNYIDPCNVDYNQHFYRDELGNIYPSEDSVEAKYMHKKLKLYLRRYGIIWMLDQLEQRMFKLEELIKSTQDEEAVKLFAEVGIKYNEYKRYLRAEQ